MLTGVTRCPTSFSDVCDLGRTVRATYIHETHRPPVELRKLSSQTISLPAPTPTCTLACTYVLRWIKSLRAPIHYTPPAPSDRACREPRQESKQAKSSAIVQAVFALSSLVGRRLQLAAPGLCKDPSYLLSFDYVRPIDVAEALVVLFSSDCRPRKAVAVAQDENYTALSLQSAVLNHMASK